MSEEIVILIIRIVAAVAAVLIARYLIPFIQAKTSAACQTTLRGIVTAAVTAAEQTITGSGKGIEKKSWVLDYLKNAGVITDTNERYVDAIIEAAVYGLNAAKEEG